MLFNSYEFIFLFLPVTLLGFHWLGKQGHHRACIAWLIVASLFFYGWWDFGYLALMLFSILFNFGVGLLLVSESNNLNKRSVLALGIVANLGLLGYYKYANFFVESFNLLAGTEQILSKIILPLAISFFTFQQVAYLVDAYRGETSEHSFLHYCLFVTFFPQLIAGPIVHHKEMLPQFARDSVYRLRVEHLSVGFAVFAIGLFKKVILADGIAVYSTPVFAAAEAGALLTFFEAWCGALAFSFQLYFDFSGYSDMAIGLARMFGIRLPLNFNSPYKAPSIIVFWKRWHITLSRFFRDFLYIPLGGNSNGELHRFFNLMITMLLGGLWHGAGGKFILWGGLHGLYLGINHGWKKLCGKNRRTKFRNFFGWITTMLVVAVAWVPFRADSIEGASNIIAGMAGINGWVLSPRLVGKLGPLEDILLQNGAVIKEMFRFGTLSVLLKWFVCLGFICYCLPNTQQIMRRYRLAIVTYKDDIFYFYNRYLEWRPTLPWVLYIAIIFTFAILGLENISEFLYFQF